MNFTRENTGLSQTFNNSPSLIKKTRLNNNSVPSSMKGDNYPVSYFQIRQQNQYDTCTTLSRFVSSFSGLQLQGPVYTERNLQLICLSIARCQENLVSSVPVRIDTEEKRLVVLLRKQLQTSKGVVKKLVSQKIALNASYHSCLSFMGLFGFSADFFGNLKKNGAVLKVDPRVAETDKGVQDLKLVMDAASTASKKNISDIINIINSLPLPIENSGGNEQGGSVNQQVGNGNERSGSVNQQVGNGNERSGSVNQHSGMSDVSPENAVNDYDDTILELDIEEVLREGP